ncbi:MAG: DUF255 domain-containing protein [Proteobacteria bacterium]|nr:DUF255 domain-containing protein [Pseudomonadota bacterium]
MKPHLLLLMALTTVSVCADPPGVSYSPELRQQLAGGLQSHGKDYRARTRHLDEDGRPLYTNRLILQDSPYLLQHAHNPVNWHPWGPQAFAQAKRENRLVFLSIGYSTCHWCHVMEHESFEDEAVAEFLNTHFVAIKVDREQRPDIDKIYMTAVQMIAGRGGWPMSSFLTADGKTFHAGTYYPRDRFMSLLQQVVKAWNENRAGILAQAEKISDGVQRFLDQAQTAGELASAAPALAVQRLKQRHDESHGGFSPAPKFPNEPDYLFLIDYARREADQELSQLIRFDLDAMARGGIYDQVGGGFHRYSTDQDWLVPHFEKMLYNQAQLSRVYLQAASLTGSPQFNRVASQTLDYVLRDMRSPDGGFYSATDADSEGHEGVFFLWTQDQIRAALAGPDAELAIRLFKLSESGNFEGSNILNLSAPLGKQTPAGQSRDEFLRQVDRIRSELYAAREERIHPLRDEKIVTAWNAMMIMALAEAAELPAGEAYADAALKAGNYIWTNNRDHDGKLWRASLNGRSSVAGVQEDYAWLADAFISLYDLSHHDLWLERARSLLERMQGQFWDRANGGYFMSAPRDDAAPAMGRPKDITDGALPAGNAAALHAMARLARRPAEKGQFLELDARANALITAFANTVNRNPSAFPYFLLAARVQADGQSGSKQYAAHGGIALSGRVQNHQLTLNIEIQPGWHINAHKPLSDYLIPTVLQAAEQNTTWNLSAVSYPPPVKKTLGFQSEELALYEGNISLKAALNARIPAPEGGLLRLTLRLQACDDEICLPPELLELQIPVPQTRQ